MTSPLRLAAVGLEHDEIYRTLDRLRRHDSAHLVAIAERSGRLRMAAEGRYRVPVFPRLTPLLAKADVDAVIVATTNGDKADIIQEALRAGKHVIAHAPLAVTPEQLTAVEEAQGVAGAGLQLLLPLRFSPAYARLREMLSQGMLGNISQAVIINSQKVAATPRTQAFFASTKHGGIFTNLAIHDLDLLRLLGGELTVSAAATQCSGLTEHPDFEDAGLVHCTFASGGNSVVACNWLAPDAGYPFRELTLIGTEGTAWVAGGKLRAIGGQAGAFLQGEQTSNGYVVSRHEPGRALPARTNAPTDFDVDSAMLDAALKTLAAADLRSAATADALRTSRVAVDAQALARPE